MALTPNVGTGQAQQPVRHPKAVPTVALFEEAVRLGVSVAYRRMNGGVLGQYDRVRRAITLHRDLLRDDRWLRAVLAHELGHHQTWHSGCTEPACLEGRASRWAARRLVDRGLLAEAFQDWIAHMADAFGVPPLLIVESLHDVLLFGPAGVATAAKHRKRKLQGRAE